MHCPILNTSRKINALDKAELIEVLLEVNTEQLEIINDFTAAILQDRHLKEKHHG